MSEGFSGLTINHLPNSLAASRARPVYGPPGGGVEGRGWGFDIDFVVNMDNCVFLTEINARRASPCHVFDIGVWLLGRNWYRDGVLYANDHLALQGSCGPDYASIRKVFREFNQINDSRGAQAIPTIASHSLLRETPYGGYVVVARNAEEAAKLALGLEKQVRKEIGMQ